MGIPPYNGGLFENDDKVYLNQYKIANRFLAEALVELAYLSDSKDDKEPERIDYRDLSVRHLGSLYEGMIEYRLFIAEEELLARRDKDGKVKYLSAEKTERKPNDELLKTGKVYFAQSPHERKATGTHYTAEDLVERLVKQTVLRLLDERWQEFEPKLTQWLTEIDATPVETQRRRLQERVDSELDQFVESQVLSMRACDPAMGSGHFLVHIAHQMTNFILRVLTYTPWENANINLDADHWRKRVVENCLYGVDINQMAVELAKLSLWLATMQLGQPLSFLDHHLKQGNSLLGASLEEIEELLNQDDFSKPTAKSILAESKGQYMLMSQIRPLQQKIGEANTLLQKIASQIVTRAEDVHQQELDFEQVEEILAPYKRIGDLIVAQKMGLKPPINEIQNLAKAYEDNSLLNDSQESWLGKVNLMLLNMHPLHWELEFPAVFWSRSKNGFDIVIGNPPFLGGKKISSELGNPFMTFIRSQYPPAINTADLCAYFFRLAFQLLVSSGSMGLVATNTIAQTDTRETGLAEIIREGGIIYFADKFVKWGGDASVEVNLVCISKRKTNREVLLDGKHTPSVSSWLDSFPETLPLGLFQNKMRGFIGDFLRGKGFVLSEEEFMVFLEKSSGNADIIKPYLVGEDINDSPNQKPKRYVICFFDWDYKKASNYPDLLSHLLKYVKPERERVIQKFQRENWWLFAGYKKDLRGAVEPFERVMVRSRVSEYHMLVFTDKRNVCGDATVVFAFDDYYHFSLLQSWIHEVWLRRQASTLESRNRYTPTDCFQTFPFPQYPSDNYKKESEQAGMVFYEHRQRIMQQRQMGLTKTYNLFNNPTCWDEDIQQMRLLQTRMDCTILACYGWNDIDLQHDIYPNDRNKNHFMPSPAAQREIFTRLLALNQEIAAQEAAQGLVVEAREQDEIDEETEA